MDGQAESGAPEDEVDRRSVIKKIGAGAALAWSAPAIVGISKASAQTASDEANRCESCERSASACDQPFPCGEDGCLCFQRADGNGNCCVDAAGGGSCFDFAACDANNECPPGYSCLTTCCDTVHGFPLLCWPSCGSGLPSKSGSSEKSADGPKAYLEG